MFGNLLRLVTAPLDIIDALVVEPLADMAEAAADMVKDDDK